MKKTLTVNLGGTVFYIDDDAYRLLDNYLNNLKHHFRRVPGGDEIVDDIERRISELFAEKQTEGLQVITLADVEAVIARVGRPEEMEQDASGDESARMESQATTEPRRRLFRDPDNKMLGGVAAGLAAFFGLDVALVRLVMLLLLIFSTGALIVVYIVCWILIPEARTAADKLSMRGVAVTLENIGRTVTDGFSTVANGANNYMRSDKPRTFLRRFGDILVTAVGWMFKIALIAIAIICSPVLLVLCVVFVALLFAAVVVCVGGGAALISMFPMYEVVLPASPFSAIVMYVSGILVVGIPLMAIVGAIFRWAFNWQPMATGLKWTLLLLWIISVSAFGICFAMQGGVFPEIHLLSV